MEWYYVKDGGRVGPIEDSAFAALVREGAIQADTYVWHGELPDWVTYGALMAAPAKEEAPAQQQAPQTLYACAECGGAFSGDEVLAFGQSYTCAACKPVFFQRIRQGTPAATDREYAGFGARFCAYFVDTSILGYLTYFLTSMGMRVIGSANGGPGMGGPWGPAMIMVPLMMLAFVLQCAYFTWFVGHFGATPGKMVMSLRIVRSSGEPVTYLRAFARFWGFFVSAIVLYIGYLMVLFDPEERRALHDYICDTRVIRERRG